MGYTEKDIFEILELSGCEEQQVIIDAWKERKSNTFLTSELNNFVYSFPLIINDEEVATITLVSLYGHSESYIDDVMQKYFGSVLFDYTYATFSHDTYLTAYLSIHKEFELPKICKGFHGETITAYDSIGKEFKFKISYGYPANENKHHLYLSFINDRSYRFDNDVNLSIDRIENGWSLGDKIKENITTRTRDFKIVSLL